MGTSNEPEEPWWSLPKYTKPYGPAEVVDALVQFRNRYPPGQTQVSDDCITKVIELCYHASMAAEEGRYPRFRLALIDRQATQDNLYVAAMLDDPKLINTVEALRKLSPAVSSFENAIGVEEIDGKPFCTHLRTFSGDNASLKLGYPRLFGGGGSSQSIEIGVGGPGELNVSELGLNLSLRRGALTNLASWWAIDLLREWLSNLGQQLADKILDETSPEDSRLFGSAPNVLTTLLFDIWSRIIFVAATRHRGAAFIVLPDESEYEPVYSYQATGFAVGDAVRNFWDVSRDYVREEDPNKKDNIANRWLSIREMLIAKTHNLANLGRVDGCVVFDRSFRLRGFGGKITVGEEEARNSQLVHTDFLSKEEQSDYEPGGGMRHRSAYWLCKSVPRSAAFVVSQDGDLTCYFSTEDSIFALRVKV